MAFDELRNLEQETPRERALTRVNASIQEFSRVVDAFAREIVPEKLGIAHRKIALDLLRSVTLKTPVDTGRARANWQLTRGAPASDALELTDKEGSQTVQKGASELSALQAFEVVWIVNNLPYVLELEEGSSQQAPQGMLKLSLLEMQTQLEALT